MLLIYCFCEAGSLYLPYLDNVTCLHKWKTVKVDCIYFNEVIFYLSRIVTSSVTWESSVFKSWWRRMCALHTAVPPQISCNWVLASDQAQPPASLPQHLRPDSTSYISLTVSLTRLNFLSLSHSIFEQAQRHSTSYISLTASRSCLAVICWVTLEPKPAHCVHKTSHTYEL